MEFCPHCMRRASGAVCPSCGGQIDWTAQPGQLSVGTLLRGAAGHAYQIGAARGQGGFGITYAAMNLNTAQRVAIKEYYPSSCAVRTQFNQVLPMTGQEQSYSGGMHSFLEEAKMLSAVGALPSVVAVRDFFEANGTAYLVMEYVDGVPLQEIVSTAGRMPAEELLPRLSALMEDLDTLHRAGVIHRDISPDNLILTPDGNLKLLDFGSARSMQTGKSMTVLLKTGFSPVEQHKSTGQGPWTDVYALAATIYYCLTGVIPQSAVERLDEDVLQSPRELGVNLSAQQEEALLWGLTVQPKNRPQSMEQFSRKLIGPEQPEDPDGPGEEAEPVSQAPAADTSAAGTGNVPGSMGPKTELKKWAMIGAACVLCLVFLINALGGGKDGPTEPAKETIGQTEETTHETQWWETEPYWWDEDWTEQTTDWDRETVDVEATTADGYHYRYPYGMETGIGRLESVSVTDDNVIIGYTNEDRAVVLDIPDNTVSLNLPETHQGVKVEWIWEGALEGISAEATIRLPPELLYDQSLQARVIWEFLENESQYTLAENWYYSGMLIYYINMLQPDSEVRMDPNLTRAAMVRAEELADHYSDDRPGGKSMSALLEEHGIEAKAYKTEIAYFRDMFDVSMFAEMNAIANKYASEYQGYNKIGLAVHFKNGNYYVAVIAIQEPDPAA